MLMERLPILLNLKNFLISRKNALKMQKKSAQRRRKAEIYVFDDSFSALDFSTDAKLRKALRERMPDITKIIVAQRVGTTDASRGHP